MLRKKSNKLKKTSVERKHKSCIVKEKAILAEAQKEVAPPASFAGFSTCFNFLRIVAAEDEKPSTSDT